MSAGELFHMTELPPSPAWPASARVKCRRCSSWHLLVNLEAPPGRALAMLLEHARGHRRAGDLT